MGALALGGALALASACGTVDVGPTTGPPEPCNAPTAFYVSDVWPQYFETYSCGKVGCHNQQSGSGFFRLYDVSMVTAPDPMAPTTVWPFEWQQNFANVTQNVSCANPTQSTVLVVPEGKSTPHPPGMTVTDPTSADALFTQWLQ